MKKLVNKTEHDITVIRNGEVVLHLDPGEPARIVYRYPWLGRVGAVNLVERVAYEVTGLPPEGGDILYVVSMQVWEHCRHRSDLVLPEFPVRDERGKVIGCAALRARRKHESTYGSPSYAVQEGA